jgi:hypothetical protein
MDDEPDVELSRWDRWMCRNRYTLWLGSWLELFWAKAYEVYDDLMIACWPYERWPNEWRSLWRKG